MMRSRSVHPAPYPGTPFILQRSDTPRLVGMGVSDLLQLGYFVPDHLGIGFQRSPETAGALCLAESHPAQDEAVQDGLGNGEGHGFQRGLELRGGQ